MTTRKAHLAAAFAALFAFGLSACVADRPDRAASPEAARLTQARAKLDGDIAACTSAHGYDPRNAGAIAENALAPGELEWRDCAYLAARNYARVNEPMRLDYELLISDDRKMPRAVQAGTMTRTERRARIETRLADIKAQEEAQLQAAASAAAEDHQQLRNTVETMRGFGM